MFCYLSLVLVVDGQHRPLVGGALREFSCLANYVPWMADLRFC